MKLYTEEQVMNALKLAHSHIKPLQYVIDTLTPIKLPSDEEIDIYVKSTAYYGHGTTKYREGIEEGAKWMRDKIQVGKP